MLITTLLPNKYLKTVKTSCGCLQAISYKSDYRKFIKDWDFKNRGKSKLTSMLDCANTYKNEDIKELYKNIHKSRTLSSLHNRLI